jgi:hypothetical protein
MAATSHDLLRPIESGASRVQGVATPASVKSAEYGCVDWFHYEAMPVRSSADALVLRRERSIVTEWSL